MAEETKEKEEKENYFIKLSKIAGETEKKGSLNLTYMSWAVAWAELKKVYPKSNYVVHENENGMPYFADETGAFVKVTVRVIRNGPTMESDDFIPEHTVLLPVMDYSNKSIQKEKLTVMDINKAIQRALVKAIAMHGLGLYVYKGEDLPEDTEKPAQKPQNASQTQNKSVSKPKADDSLNKQVEAPCICSTCDAAISAKVRDYSINKYGVTLCFDCQQNYGKEE